MRNELPRGTPASARLTSIGYGQNTHVQMAALRDLSPSSPTDMLFCRKKRSLRLCSLSPVLAGQPDWQVSHLSGVDKEPARAMGGTSVPEHRLRDKARFSEIPGKAAKNQINTQAMLTQNKTKTKVMLKENMN